MSPDQRPCPHRRLQTKPPMVVVTVTGTGGTGHGRSPLRQIVQHGRCLDCGRDLRRETAPAVFEPWATLRTPAA